MTRWILDVTNVSTQPFLTGIQRTIRSVANKNAGRLQLVRFDDKAAVFREVESIPSLKKRRRGFWFTVLAGIVAPLFLLLSRGARTQNGGTFLPKFVVNAGKRLHHFLFNDDLLDDNPRWRENRPWEPGPGEVLLILEVPQDRRHLKKLREISRNRSVEGFPRICVYLYDLIPIRQALEYDPRPAQIVSGSFPDFVDFVQGVDDVVFLSQYTKNEYLEVCEAKALTSPSNARGVVYLPVDATPQASAPQPKNTNVIKILGIGALDRRKNFIVVLRALEQLSQKGIRFELKLVKGTGKLIDPRISDFLRSAPDAVKSQIDILSFVSDRELRGLYEWSTVVVVPSIAEGFGLPVVEALERGKNVIASDATSLSELAQYFDVKLAPPHNPSTWATLLHDSLHWEAPRHRVGKDFPRDWVDFFNRITREIPTNGDDLD